MKKKFYEKPLIRAIGIKAESCLLTASGVTDEQMIYREQSEDKETPNCNAEKMNVNPEPVPTFINGHEYVDLGLPSVLKWATCNVGASTPEEYGDYFAWGETAAKSGDYDRSNSATYNKTINELKMAGILGSDNHLTAAHDAAAKNWGGTWRMPTSTEIQELIDNCDWTWNSDHNGVAGFEVKSKKNDNSIFLPAAGYRTHSSSAAGISIVGYYWSSSAANQFGDSYASSLNFFISNYQNQNHLYRHYGNSVRPVSE